MKKPKYIPEFADIPTGRHKMPELPLEERKGNFDEVELGLGEESVLAEAARCLSCRRCIGCGLCLAECDQDAVVYDETATDIKLEADAIVFTSDGQAYNPDRKRELGYCDSANVITSLEFERLVSPNGPFGGYLLRPFDGDVPRRLGFIQCVGSREEGIGANYCSTVCCSRTLFQAARAREILGAVTVHVFHRGLRPIGKRSELDLGAMEDADWIDFTETLVSEVKEDPETGTVTVTYSAGEKEESAEFDLVVLAVGVQSTRDFRKYGRPGGIKPNKFGFVARSIGDLIAAQAGVAYAGSIAGPRSAEDAAVDAAAAVSRCLEASDGEKAGGDGGPGEGGEAGEGRARIYACEYGLALAGKDKSWLEKLGADGVEVDGAYPFLCYKDGRAAMAGSLAGASGSGKGSGPGGASGLVVIGCHRAGHESLFERVLGLPGGSVAIVGKDDLDGGLKDAVTAAVGRIREGGGAGADGGEAPKEASAQKRPAAVAILGGGTSGLAAASELLRRGANVVLVEKGTELGRSLLDAAVDADGDGEEEGGGAEGFIESIKAHPAATVLVSSHLMSVERSGGGLTLKVTGPEGDKTLKAGALLLATGGESYAAEDYHYGATESILSQPDFRAKAVSGEGKWKRVVMIQCVGARDAEHPYCSRFCCRQALSNAALYRSNNPGAEITILHKGMRVFGFDEELLTDSVDSGIEFVEITGSASIETEKGLRVAAKSAAGERVAIDCDVVVLSLAHAHGEVQQRLSEITGAPLDELGFIESRNVLANPFATQAEGIYACGLARRPVVVEDAFIEGVGAAGVICRALGI